MTELKKYVPQSLKNKIHLIQAIFWDVFYLFPSKKLKIIGVTGTDGKTTTSFLIYQILKLTGKKVSLISTTGAYIGRKEIETGLHTTTPESRTLQKLIVDAKNAGSEFLVIEVTSHGLDQHRLWGISFYISVLTNITHEHLDYHQTMEKYALAKAKLFNRSKVAVINKKYHKFVHFVKNKKLEVNFVSPSSLPHNLKKAVYKKFTQGYNRENLALAIVAARKLGISYSQIESVIEKLKTPEGRLDYIPNDRGIRLIVDFAHTPNALEELLKFLSKTKSGGNLIVVFGSAGERDKTKRPLMGKVAAKFADKIVLTAEDPRTDSVSEINSQIKRGIKGLRAEVFEIEHRGKAIYFAINDLAKKGDTVVVCGKGHEESMCFDCSEYSWSERKAVLYALAGKTLSYGKKR
jgi:UDP-N-acetylmuramoyl-L-alanyl-D-glutamate--2,6-diaminopimelate ligase